MAHKGNGFAREATDSSPNLSFSFTLLVSPHTLCLREGMSVEINWGSRMKTVLSGLLVFGLVATGSVANAAGPRSGEEVYGAKCVACHASGAAGAQILGDTAAWAPVIGKGIDVLYTNTISGFNGMPAKGLCFDCTDDELRAAVDYMVQQSQ